ncbi:hypothetical protein HDU84_005322 [Entophlyctis sp. JEL0112]|nr:hypothetical protein HDU84_005322 [Entophlyctis sp. JEL0112]
MSELPSLPGDQRKQSAQQADAQQQHQLLRQSAASRRTAKTAPTTPLGANSGVAGTSSQAICLDLLAAGHIHSYITFFALTHDAPPAAAPAAAPAATAATATAAAPPAASPPLAPDQLAQVAQLLTTHERAVRAGARPDVYAALRALGAFFRGTPRGTQYLRDAYDAVRAGGAGGGIDLSGAPRRAVPVSAAPAADLQALEVEAAIALGQAVAETGQFFLHIQRAATPTHATGDREEALRLYELGRALALDIGDADTARAAQQHIVAARIQIANDFESQGNYRDAIEEYIQCMRTVVGRGGETGAESAAPESTPAVDADTAAVINDLNYRLGLAYKQDNQIDAARAHLSVFLAAVADDTAAPMPFATTGAAHLALAACYESAGEFAEAAQTLHMVIDPADTAARTPDTLAVVARACAQLGALCNRVGDYAQATEYFNRHFALACDVAHCTAAAAAAGAADTAAAAGTAAARTTLANPADALGAALIQVGLAKANAHLLAFFDCIAACGRSSSRDLATAAAAARKFASASAAPAGARNLHHPALHANADDAEAAAAAAMENSPDSQAPPGDDRTDARHEDDDDGFAAELATSSASASAAAAALTALLEWKATRSFAAFENFLSAT